MHEPDEREIFASFDQLRNLTPTQEESALAIEHAIEHARAAPSPRPRRSIRLWLLPGSIAAGLLLAAALIWSFGQTRPVSAAELLRQVIDKTSGYRGWVHVIMENTDGTLPEAVNGIYPGWHMNRADGTRVIIARGNGKLSIQMDIPSTGEMSEYDGGSNLIRHGDMIPYNVGATQRNVERQPIDLASQMAMFREFTRREPLQVKSGTDGDWDTFDIQFFADEKEAGDVLQPLSSMGSLPIHTRIWVDRGSRLIQRNVTTYVTRFGNHRKDIRVNPPASHRMFYGAPAIGDIYEAGAPPDALVKDFRIQGEAKTLWERLERRHADDYGDGAAIIFSSELSADGSIDPAGKGASIEVYLRQGAQRYFADYFVNDKPSRSGRRRIPPFAHWPDVTLEEVLARARQADWSDLVFISDGTRAWGGGLEYTRWLDEKDMVWWDGERGHSVSGRIWPTRRSMWVYNTRTSFSLSADPQRPGTILLHAQQFSTDPPANAANPQVYREIVYWLDPAHDDVPVRKLLRHYEDDHQKTQPTVQREYDYDFFEHAQLSNGQWYPARWRQTNKTNKHGTLEVESAYDVRLRIYPGARIDPAWFQLPTE